MNITQIENNVQKLTKKLNKKSFIYDFLLAYDQPKSSIKRLKDGDLNLSKVAGELAWKKKLFYKESNDKDLHVLIDDLKNNVSAIKHDPRFIMVTDYETILALDRKTQDTLDIQIQDLAKYFDFFLPLAGMEKAQKQSENPADVKAAERMAKLYDEIKQDNPSKNPEKLHSLNVFLTRLLFCFFAEDTGILDKGQFTMAVKSHTQMDGSDLNVYLDKLFTVMNTESSKRKNLPAYLEEFPYVNGGLLRDKHSAPIFTKRSRQMLLDMGDLNWSEINPDIFGSMFQAVISPEHRGGLGMHYTSVPNIMKVIEPLFLNELNEEFEASGGNTKKLNTLLNRIQKIKIFDPACGSGNFLVIAYKELRRLEMKIFKALEILAMPNISLNNFYGIEIDDFAHEVALLSLWLAEHQMNMEFFNKFGILKPALPLKEAGNIVCGNACRLDWEKVFPKNEDDESYILGNPPYLGGKLQSGQQKEDSKIVFKGFNKYNNLDYIACWFYKASLYIDKNMKAAFVSTNSISQGTQVHDLWPYIFKFNIELFFAYKDFPWTNNAKNKAAVICSIIGLRHTSNQPKYLFENKIKRIVSNINGYLMDAPNIFIEKRTSSLSALPDMNQGNIPLESGFLRFEDAEKEEITKKYPNSSKLFKKVSGSEELINNLNRWCIWVKDENLNLAMSIEPIRNRIKKVIEFRKNGAENAKACLNRPHQFCMLNVAKHTQIVVPIVSSERRKYIPVSFVNNDYIILNSALVIYDPEIYIFGLINSRIHMIWVKTFSGKLKSDFRYSVGLCWFSFPFPSVSDQQKKELEKYVYRILEEREKHSEQTLAQMYDPENMPEGLREAHHQNDLAVERCYRSKPFENDEERLEYLFKLYEQMIAEEQTKGTLFEVQSKNKKRKK